MAKPTVRIGVGTHLIYDGEAADVVELQPTTSGVDVTLRIGAHGKRAIRISMRELLDGGRAAFVTVWRQRQLVRREEVFQSPRQRNVGGDRLQQRLRVHRMLVGQLLAESG